MVTALGWLALYGVAIIIAALVGLYFFDKHMNRLDGSE